MRVIVCGGRDYADAMRVRDTLDGIGVTELVHGGADGADELAGQWAILRSIPLRIYRANWLLHGKAAGPIRNQEMLDRFKPDAVIAFPGGRGTANMIKLAKAAGVCVIEVSP